MMNDDWACYPTQNNEHPTLVQVNTQLADAMESVARPWLLSLDAPLTHVDDQGLPDEQEHEPLQAMDHFMDAYAQTNQGLYVGNISALGMRGYYLYLPKQPSDDEVSLFLEHIQDQLGYDAQAQCTHDEAHSAYWDTLFPKGKHWDYLENLTLIESIREYGDDVERPRSVTHWVYFDDEDSREQFSEWAQANGFEVSRYSEPGTDADDVAPHGVELSHIICPNIDTITETTQQLKEAAQAFSGQYDGWETSLARTVH